MCRDAEIQAVLAEAYVAPIRDELIAAGSRRSTQPGPKGGSLRHGQRLPVGSGRPVPSTVPTSSWSRAR